MNRLFAISLILTTTLVQAVPFAFMPLGRIIDSTPGEGVISLSGDLYYRAVSTGLVAARIMRINEIGGIGPLRVSGIDCPESFTCTWSGIVEPGGYADVPVFYAPDEVGQRGGNIAVSANAASGNNTIACSGYGTSMRISDGYIALHNLQDDEWFQDMDGDMYTTFEEWLAGTDPREIASHLQIQPADNGGGGFIIKWPSVAGRLYNVHRSINLTADPQFELIAPGIIGVDPETTFIDTDQTAGSARVYRIEIPVSE